MSNFFKKLLFCLIAFLFIFSANSLAITQEECERKIGKRELSLDEAKECEKILSDLYLKTGEQKRTLQGEIAKFNAAINLTTTRIYTTLRQIEELEKEIAALAAKIDRLDLSLDQVSQILIRRIAETYKKGKIEPLAL
ncbi:MAG: hypothetical protein ACPLXP_03445, partial [Microgenomates group bacterium]